MSWNLRSAKTSADRTMVLRERFVAVLSRFRPTVVAVGIRDTKSAAAAEMRKMLEEMALAHGLPVVYRRVVESRKLLLGRPGGNAQNALARQLVRGFFPRLAAWKKGSNSSRYRCHAFSALAIALHELALRAPLSAAAISNAEGLSVYTWNEFLAEQTRKLYPQENL